MTTSSLIVVGSGIKFMSHLTSEARANIEQSNKVLYLINEPAMKKWIHKVNPEAESLDNIYIQHNLRQHSYQAITDYILQALYKNQHVCVVLYGHPSVFAKPALSAVIQAKKKGYYAKILPGISAEDCLFADLLIDPGSNGCLSLEVTDLLIHRRQLDTSYHLILWQIGIIGVLNHTKQHDNSKGTKLLLDYLSQYYNLDQQIISYTAAQYPGFDPKIERFKLKNISEIAFSRISTLYIPPTRKIFCDTTALDELGIDIFDLKIKESIHY